MIESPTVTSYLSEHYADAAYATLAGYEATGGYQGLRKALGMDPVELRIKNDTQVDPEDPDKPFSERHFIEALRVGADKFGWAGRNAKPAAMRDGRERVEAGDFFDVLGA